MELYFFTVTDVKMIHAEQIQRYGGFPGIRDINLLDSAIHYPQATFDKRYVYSDIYSMAAAHVGGIIKKSSFLWMKIKEGG